MLSISGNRETMEDVWQAIIILCLPALVLILLDFALDAAGIGKREPATWGDHLVIGPVCLFITILAIRLLRGFLIFWFAS